MPRPNKNSMYLDSLERFGSYNTYRAGWVDDPNCRGFEIGELNMGRDVTYRSSSICVGLVIDADTYEKSRRDPQGDYMHWKV